MSIFPGAAILLFGLMMTNAQYKIPLRKPIPENPSNSTGTNPSPNNSTGEAEDDRSLSQNLNNDNNVAWIGPIQIGNPPQEFIVQFDSGSSDLWIPCVGCESNGCTTRQFVCDQSNTCTSTNNPFSIQYGSGSAQGLIDRDRVCIGDAYYGYCTDTSQQFACATYTTDMNFAFDGILGIGWASLSNGMSPVMDKIYNTCATKTIGFYLNNMEAQYWNSEPLYYYGELTVCGSDTSKYYGTPIYIPLAGLDWWRVAVSDVRLGGRSIVSGSQMAIVDTGTTMLTGPSSAINAIFQTIGMTSNDHMPCNSTYRLPSLVFYMNGYPFTLTPKDYMLPYSCGQAYNCCYPGLSIYDQTADNEPMWILGDVFIGKYYTIFDHAQQRIGLAVAKGRWTG